MSEIQVAAAMMQRLIACAALSVCLHALSAAGFAPAPILARRAPALLTKSDSHRLGGAVSCRPTLQRKTGLMGLRAGSEDEVDIEAFRDLLNDSWATTTAKSDDGVMHRSLLWAVRCLHVVHADPFEGGSSFILHCI